MSFVEIALLIIIVIVILSASRKVAALAIIFSACYFCLGTNLVIGPAHLSVWRIAAISGMLRVLIRKEILIGGLNKMDKLMIAYTVVAIITGTLLAGNIAGFINRAGLAFDLIGSYFAFRFLIFDMDDFNFLLRGVAYILIPLGILFLAEKYLSKNIFSYFGGAPLEVTVREGKTRASGPFLHPILAGTFAATFIPIILTLWWGSKKDKILCLVTLFSLLAIVYSCSSSGPIMSVLFGIIGLSPWRYRYNMKRIRWIIVLGLVCLQLSMKAPVWFLLARIDLTGSSTGWYRAQLISSALEHFSEWWLIGTNYTRHWMATGIAANANNCDIINQFILNGVNGGIILLALFVYLIAHCFHLIGRLNFSFSGSEKQLQIIPWGFGAALFAHLITFFSVSYFDQTIISIYFIFAMISFLSVRSQIDVVENVSIKGIPKPEF